MIDRVYHHEYFGDFCYSVDIPKQFEGKENVPLLLFLNGAGERGFDHELLKRIALPKFLQEGRVKVNAITVCPQCPENIRWINLTYMLCDFLEFIIEEYKIDRNRISMTGVSMGGFGTWEMAMFAPKYFKKIAPVCGGGMNWSAGLITADVWAFHGDNDPAVPVEYSLRMVDTLKKIGKDARLTIFHGVEHNSWDEAYLDSRVLEWLTEY